MRIQRRAAFTAGCVITGLALSGNAAAGGHPAGVAHCPKPCVASGSADGFGVTSGVGDGPAAVTLQISFMGARASATATLPSQAYYTTTVRLFGSLQAGSFDGFGTMRLRDARGSDDLTIPVELTYQENTTAMATLRSTRGPVTLSVSAETTDDAGAFGLTGVFLLQR